jgi:hypothetical protein
VDAQLRGSFAVLFCSRQKQARQIYQGPGKLESLVKMIENE